MSRKLEEKYDVVIIGSGMGGLASGLILAKEGYKVCILEKEAQIGGTLQTFKRGGQKFDTGVHYIGGLDEGQPLHPYFEYLDLMDKITIEKMDSNGFDLISFDGDSNRYPHAQGHDNFVHQLLKYFPDEEKGLTKYVEDMKTLCSKFSLYNILGNDNQEYNELDYMGLGTKNFIESCTSDKKLSQILAGTNLLYAGEANSSPAFIHALVVNSYILSSYKFLKGGGEISKSLNYSIRALGGKVIRNAEVTSINHHSKQADSVTLKTGEVIKADIFISNIPPVQTLKLMDTGLIRKSYVQRISKIRNSTSVFMLYLVVKPKTVPYFNHNNYHFGTKDVWNGPVYKPQEWGNDFAVYSMPDHDNPQFCAHIGIMTYMHFDEVGPWKDSFNTTLDINDRGSNYEEFKEKKSALLLKKAEKIIPNLRANTVSYYSSTPLTQRDYLNTVDGSLYGIMKDFNSPLKSQINTRTKLSNLFLTGQNIVMHGVLGTTVGAVVTCGEIVGKDYLVNKIRSKVMKAK